MKRIIAALLALLMLASMIACVSPQENGDETSSQQTTKPGTNAETTEPETTEDPHKDNGLPEMNFNGEVFRFLGNGTLSMDNTPQRDLIYLEDVQTNSINEAVRDRNDYVSDMYGVSIRSTWVDGNDEIASFVKKDKDSDLQNVDSFTTGMNTMGNLIDSGYLVDLNSLKYLDLSQSYWNQTCRTEMSVAHKLFFISGDIISTDKEGCWSIQFNRDLINNNLLESPYVAVDSYQWTYDKMYWYASQVCDYEQHDPNDTFNIIWGVATEHNNTYFMWQGGGTRLIVKDPVTDIPQLNEFTDSAYDAMMGTAKVQYTKGISILQSDIKGVSGNTEGIIKLFKEGHALFKVGSMSMVEWMREYDQDFGVLPLPMTNESQGKYYSSQSETYGYTLAVPTGVHEEKRDFVSFVLEALACESTDTLLAAYYEKTLVYKGLRKEEDEKMLNLIFDSRIYDLSLVFSWSNALTEEIRTAKTESKVKRIKNNYDKYASSITNEVNKFLTKHGLA